MSVLAFNRAELVVVLTRSRQPQGLAGRKQNIGSGWGRGLVAGVQRKRVSLEREPGRNNVGERSTREVAWDRRDGESLRPNRGRM